MSRSLLLALVLVMVPQVCGSQLQRPIPDDARRHFIRGHAAMKLSNSEADMSAAAREFASATAIAPWWADAWRNLGIALDAAGQSAEAIAALRKFIELAPNDPDAQKARDQVIVIEYKMEKAQKARTDKAAALAALAGTWRYERAVQWPGWPDSAPNERDTGQMTLTVAGDRLTGALQLQQHCAIGSRTDCFRPNALAEDALSARTAEGGVEWRYLASFLGSGRCTPPPDWRVVAVKVEPGRIVYSYPFFLYRNNCSHAEGLATITLTR